MGKIFYYTNKPETADKLQMVCERQKLFHEMFKLADANRTLWEIVGLGPLPKESSAQQHTPAPLLFQLPECVYFYGLLDSELDAFLGAWKAAGFEPIALKAMATMHNLGWTLYELTEELKKEHQALQ